MNHTPSPAPLPPELTIYTVGEVHASLCQNLSLSLNHGEQVLQLDAAQVAEVDSAGVQALLALALSCEQQGRSLSLMNPSPALVQASTALGAQSLLTSNLGAAS